MPALIKASIARPVVESRSKVSGILWIFYISLVRNGSNFYRLTAFSMTSPSRWQNGVSEHSRCGFPRSQVDCSAKTRIKGGSQQRVKAWIRTVAEIGAMAGYGMALLIIAALALRLLFDLLQGASQ